MKNSRVGIVTQVRMTSTRLPGKVLKLVRGKSLLEHHLERLKSAELPIIVATTVNATDDVIADLCQKLAIECVRGSEDDVLSRYWLAVEKYSLDTVVRVTSDCPLIDGKIIGEAVGRYINRNDGNIYLSNCQKRSFPRGMDFEIFSAKLLKEAFQHAKESSEREHVTPYIWRRKNPKVIVDDFLSSEDSSQFRLTVDEPLDFALIERLILDYDADKLSCSQIVRILNDNPELAAINSSIEQKKI